MDAFRRKFGHMDDEHWRYPLLKPLAFDRVPGESFAIMYERFDIVCQDAEEASGFIMTIEVYSVMIIKFLRLKQDHFEKTFGIF